jgi:DNA-binding NtrC family response regulator
MSKILIVDDEDHIRADLARRLQKMSHQVVTADTVEKALQSIQKGELEYALIDLKLDYPSEFGGIKVFNYILKNKPHIKPIVLSSYPFQDVKEQLKKEVKNEKEPDIILKKIEEDYLYKGSVRNYILAVLDKLEELEQKKLTGRNKYEKSTHRR